MVDLRARTADQVAGLLAVAFGLLGLTLLIALAGTTTALPVHERTGEIGLLRALGLGRGGGRAMITTKAGLYGAIGAVLGLLPGVPPRGSRSRRSTSASRSRSRCASRHSSWCSPRRPGSSPPGGPPV
ncbi:MAG: FtsX-like permease family protein [Umezawaea sp.]